jgi:hypothetical protein
VSHQYLGSVGKTCNGIVAVTSLWADNRHKWAEQSYKQMKDELGWADFMVGKDDANGRHWELVCCTLVFCRWYADCGWRVSNEIRHPDRLAPPSMRREKSQRREKDAVLDPVTVRGKGLACPGVLVGPLPGRVLRNAPAPP